ncbi:signal peptidase II [Ornithinimicrobium cryptoxanthini]|uniref:Lipoprotein signal peptidase n=1 Tax=Ornithinimicrobium cryptoxanthini TaxID=2934161 RepID=A0ABY4YL08_9MICO|nr:signal peptidase II [Ornithinimicrobium cryptoxanthini]USQ77486.1 signal peptidase II [Ornithinimicrobium cryptoxanthini]
MQAEAGAPLTSQAGDDATDSITHRPVTRSLFWLVLGIAAVWVVVDQVTKNLAEEHLSDGSTIQVVGEIFQLHLTYNSGAAFSMGTGSTGLLTILASIVSVVIIWNARRLGSLAWAWGLGLLLGGAVGNLTDRLIRPPEFGKGHVVDFFQLPNFPIFNVADIGITSAAVLIGILALRGINPDGTRHTKNGEDKGAESREPGAPAYDTDEDKGAGSREPGAPAYDKDNDDDADGDRRG